MEPRTFRRLLALEGQELLAEVRERAASEPELSLGASLRARFDAELVSAAVSQFHLRQRAVAKFGPAAARMYFTPESLEQSTRHRVAAHRANRLASMGVTELVDLGCGIGGDLIAFARAGLTVRGVDSDPVRAAIAQANIDALGLVGQVRCGDAMAEPIGPDEVAFVDPARRNARGRTWRLDELQPSWPWVATLLRGRAVAKVMPGIAHRDVPANVEAEWVSDSGDLVEASLWGAPFASVERRATVLPAAETLTASNVTPRSADLAGYVFEPDDAVIRAGLVGELADAMGGWLLDPQIAYIGLDGPVATEFARGFAVIEELPFREKLLRGALRDRDIGTLTIKKRGVDVVPEQLIKRLRLGGTQTATIVMTRIRGKGRAFLVDPLPR